MKKIKLTQGKYAIVDDAYYEWLNQWKWRAVRNCKGGNWYAIRTGYPGGEPRVIYMHRLVLGLTDPKVYCDHTNHNGLDNRRKNLRSATNAQNQHNRRKSRATCSSQYKGVCRDKKKRKWAAFIAWNRKLVFLGAFLDEKEAALAYDRAACDMFGINACLNFGEWI